MPVICQKCGIEVDDRGSKVEFIDHCQDCEREDESDDDGMESDDVWPDDADYDFFVADFSELIPDNTGMRWSADYTKEIWLNGTMPDSWVMDCTTEDGKPLWWSDEIDGDPLIHYGDPPIQWDPWV